jgi:hypothetical protein
MNKIFLAVMFSIIGVKPGRHSGMREDGKAVKLRFWAAEKEREDL